MIGPSIVIKGTVSGDEDLLVQGKVEGSIELRDNEVSVGQSGRVTADVDAKVQREVLDRCEALHASLMPLNEKVREFVMVHCSP